MSSKGVWILLRPVIACVLLTLLLFVIMVSIVLRPILLKQSVQHAEYSMSVIDSELLDMQKCARTTAAYTLLSESCVPLLNSTSSQALRIDTITNGLHQMRLYASSNSKIDSLAILNRKAGYIFSTQLTPIKTVSEDEDIFPEWLNGSAAGTFFRRTLKTEVNGRQLMAPRDVYTYVAPNIYENGILQSAVVVNLSIDYLDEKIEDSMDMEEVSLLISNGQDTITYCDEQGVFSENAAKQIVNELQQKQQRTKEQNVGGNRYLFIYHPSDVSDICLIAAYRCSAIYRVIYQIQRTLIIIFVCVLLVGFLLSLNISVRIHAKNKEKDISYKALEERSAKSLLYERQKFWLDYLTQKFRYTETEFAARMHELQLENADAGNLVLLHLELGTMADETAASGMETQMSELFLRLYRSFSPLLLVNIRRDYLFLLRKDAELSLTSVSEIAKQFVQESVCHFELIGSECVVVHDEFPRIWKELTFALAQMYFYPFDSYLPLSLVLKEHSDTSIQSNGNALRQISNAVVGGDGETAQRLFEQYECSLKVKTYESYFNCIMQIVLNITDMIQKRQSTLSAAAAQELQFDAFCEAAHNCRKAASLRFLVQKYISDASAYLSNGFTGGSAKDKILQICDYVQKNYGRSEITSIEISEKFGISPDYLRKIFKASTGKALAEYISHTRLTAAAEMILDSDRTFVEISGECGFSNVNYFYTAFKKYYGVTPKMYRAIQTGSEPDSSVQAPLFGP